MASPATLRRVSQPAYDHTPPSPTTATVENVNLFENTLIIAGKTYHSSLPLQRGLWDIGTGVNIIQAEGGFLISTADGTLENELFVLVDGIKKESVVWKGVIRSVTPINDAEVQVTASGIIPDGSASKREFTVAKRRRSSSELELVPNTAIALVRKVSSSSLPILRVVPTNTEFRITISR